MSNRWKGGLIQAYFDPLTPGEYLAHNLYVWGKNDLGQLGLNTGINASSPAQSGAGEDWGPNGTAGQYVGANVKANGTLWVSGQNTNGVRGDNTAATNIISSPVQIGALTTWSKISATRAQFLALNQSNALFSWGLGTQAALGHNDTISRSSPVQVGSDTDWLSVHSSLFDSFVFKNNGTLWGWGQNLYGELGINNNLATSSPTQIGALSDWSKIGPGFRHCLAIKTDGTLWGWGDNNNGAVGNNSGIAVSSPVQVGALTNWANVSSTLYGSFGLKTDGTLWFWGDNASGELGNNGAQSVLSSPVQVGALTDWQNINAIYNAILATKTNGTLWAWGANGDGQLGFSSGGNVSSPTQVGSETDWNTYNIAAGARTIWATVPK